MLLEKLDLYFSYPFVQYALIVGILIALCASLLGVTLVLKRFSFIGDGLSHVAFGALAVASVMRLTDNLPFVLGVTVLSAILLLRSGQNTKIKGEAAIAMMSVSFLAIGYLLMNIFATSANVAGDVCSTLFGSTSILTLSKTDVYLCIALSLAVVCCFLFFYNKFFAINFDESFALSLGINVSRYNLIIAVMVAVIIVLAMYLVGALLISALIIFPALAAMQVFDNYKAVTICSVCIGVISTAVGILASILASTPVGATIVVVNMLVFGLFYLWGSLFPSD